MSRLKHNLLANFIGNGWTVFISAALIPLYIRFIGIEAYGLIGFYATLQAVFSILDLGLATTITREMARLSAQSDSEIEIRNLVRTLEIVYWAVASLIGVTVIILAPFFANYWLQAKALSSDDTLQAIVLMGCVMVFRWPFAFYSGGLVGLQRQVFLNAIKIPYETARSGGVVLVLWLVSPTIQAFFVWQMLVGLLGTLGVAWGLWHCLPKSEQKPRFKLEQIRRIWRFAAGMSGITLLSIIIMQSDKIILSKLLSLELFGYYSLASVVAMSLLQVSGPLVSAFFPQFTQSITIADDERLRHNYHQACQLVAVLTLPVAFTVALFSHEILLLWTQDLETARNTSVVLSVLIIGTALNGLMNMPYALQVAYGWTKLTFYINLFSIVVQVPLIFFLAKYYGAVGAAFVWVLLNFIYVTVGIQLMHRRLLQGEKKRWYLEDIGIPMAAAIIPVSVGKVLLGGVIDSWMQLAFIIIVWSCSLTLAAIMTPFTRSWLVSTWFKRKNNIVI